MKTSEFIKILSSGIKPVVEFDDTWEDFDKGMRGRIISYGHERQDSMFFICDLSEYEDYNDMFDQGNWNDPNGIPCLKWRETKYYPKDGKYKIVLYTDVDDAVNFVIVDESPLYKEYRESNAKVSYVKWLEIELIQSRNKA